MTTVLRPALIVTRPQPQASSWVRALRAQGVAAESCPLIDIGPAPDAQALAHWRQNWRTQHAVMCVSGAAVRGFFGAPHEPDAVQVADVDATRWWSPGPGTTESLHQAGVPAGQVDAPADDAPQFDSEHLWAVVAPQLRSGLRVLIVRGADAQGQVAGRAWLAERLRAAGVQLQEVAAYRRGPPAWNPAQLTQVRAWLAPGQPWLLSSSEAVVNLVDALTHAGWSGDAVRAALAGCEAWCTHPRIAQAAHAQGFGRVQEIRPLLADVVASVKSAP